MLPNGKWNGDRMSSVKVLPFDGRPNAEFPAWKRSVCLHMEAKFGSAGSVFRTGKYFIPPQLQRPSDEDLSANNDASGLKKAIFLQALGRRDKNVEDLENAKQYMYADLFSMISEESKRKLSEGIKWANIETAQCPKSLMDEICTVHQASNTGSTQYDRLFSRRIYNRLRQAEKESLASFYKRTQECLDTQKSIGQENVPESEQAIDFLYNILQREYSGLNEKLVYSEEERKRSHTAAVAASDIATVGAFVTGYPLTLLDAFQRANSYQVTNATLLGEKPKHQQIAFATGASDHHEKPAKPTRIADAVWAKMTKEQRNKHINENAKNRTCKYCKKTGHADRNCEVLAASVKAIQLETERKIVAMTWQDDYNDEDPDTQTVYTIQSESVLSHDNIKTETALASTVHVSSTSVLCDHCASASIFHHAPLLTNIRSCSPVKFSGVGGGIVVSKEGDFGDFGIVKYDPRASFNILSVDSLPDGAAVMYDHASRRHTVLLNNITYHFDVPLGAKGLPLRDFHVQPPNSVSHVQLNTVSQNEASHTHRQVIEAKRASEFGRLLAYPSMKDASAAISGGVFIDNPITLQSLKTSDTIYGTSVACLKGKTVHTPSEIEKIIEVKQDHSQKLRLYADILFVEGNPILLSSSDPIHLLIATSLSSRTSLSISKALNAHIAVYTQENFTISSILVDSESGLLSLREDYARQGIRVDTAPPGQHVPVIERKIRLVKERCRAIMSVLPCPLCRALLVALVLFVVSRINLLPVMGAKAAPHSWNRISPREALTGRKMSYTRDLRVGFLDYVQLVEPVNISTHNTLTPRTRGGVALQPLSNSSGAVKFLLLDTGAVVVRSKFTVLPMPDIVIKHLTALAAADKKTVSKNPLFQYHGRAIPDMINDEVQEGAMINDEVQEGALDTDLDIDTTDPHTNDDVDVGDPRTQLEIPITDEDSGTDVLYGQQYDFVVDEIPTNNDALERIQDIPAPIDLQNIGEPRISQAELSTVDKNDKIGMTKSTDDEGQIGGVNDEQIGGAKAHTRVHFVRDPYLLRDRKPKQSVLHTECEVTHEHCHNLSVNDAIKLHGDSAVAALVGECTNLTQKATFRPMHIRDMTADERKSIIRSKTFMKEKTLADGSFDKLKARLVAGGHQQDRSIYTKEETASPTVATASVFTCATIAAHERRHVITMDVGAAFLNADMLPDKPVFMKLDPIISAILAHLDKEYEEYTQQDGSIIVKLEKALYGCVQSAALWYYDLRKTLESNNYICNPYDVCVFNKKEDRVQTTVLFHVDDLMASSIKDECLTELYNILVSKYGKVTITRGLDHSYLGMRFQFYHQERTVNISMSGFISDIITQSGLTGKSACPANENLFITKESPLLDIDRSVRFHTFVAKLLYLSKRMRPDLLTLVSFLTTRVQNPTDDDENKLFKGVRYLSHTRNLSMNLGIIGDVKITAYIDASFAIHADMRSHTGVMITLGKGSLYSRSSKQKLNTKSSTESELVAISDALPQLLWFQRFLSAQGYPKLPAHIWEDNESTITLAKTGRSCSERSRHIEIRYFWIHDYLKNGTITIGHLGTDEMAADMFTKPLQGAKFLKFRQLCLSDNDV